MKNLIAHGKNLAAAIRNAVEEKNSLGVIVDITRCPGEDRIKLIMIRDTLRADEKEVMIAIDAGDLEISRKKKLKAGDSVRYTIYRDSGTRVNGVRYGSVGQP